MCIKSENHKQGDKDEGGLSSNIYAVAGSGRTTFTLQVVYLLYGMLYGVHGCMDVHNELLDRHTGYAF